MNWYIESSRTEDNYLKNVRMTVEPCMNYICAKMFEVSKLYENQKSFVYSWDALSGFADGSARTGCQRYT